MVALGKFESGTLAQKFSKLGDRCDSLSSSAQVRHALLVPFAQTMFQVLQPHEMQLLGRALPESLLQPV